MDSMKSQETQLQKSSEYVLNNLYIEKNSEYANIGSSSCKETIVTAWLSITVFLKLFSLNNDVYSQYLNDVMLCSHLGSTNNQLP